MNMSRPDELFEGKNRIEAGRLYLVSTPIGNLEDISLRALKVLSGVDFIASEDTRNSGKLLRFFGIDKPMISYFEHNKQSRSEQILDRLKSGQSCALITDAGTPGISDPGADLVLQCYESGIAVTAVPGCCAAIDAVVLSGLPTDRFVFEGFLPVVPAKRKKVLSELQKEERTVLLHEAPHKLIRTLEDLCRTLGPDRRISLCRELTKLNEEIKRCTLEQALAYYRENEPRGEFILVIQGGTPKEECFWADMTPVEHVAHYEQNGLSRMDAIKQTAKDRKVTKNEIYQLMVNENRVGGGD